MDDKVRINIQIGDNKHPLFVSLDEEAIFRDAARLVNDRLMAYTRKSRASGLPKDYLMAFAAVDIAARFVQQDRDSNAESAEQSLKALAAEIRDYLSN